MKSIDFFWDHPALRSYLHEFRQGEVLFKQGEPSQFMYLIVSGWVELYADKNGKAYPVTYVEAGSLLGESSFVSDEIYPRFFSARAVSDLKVIRLDRHAAETLRKTSPELLIDILQSTFKATSDRLNRMNRLIGNLRSTNKTERFLYLLLHLCSFQGRSVPEGKEVVLNLENVKFYMDMSEFEMEDILTELCKRKTLIRRDINLYVIPNEKKLLQQIPQLREEISPLPIL